MFVIEEGRLPVKVWDDHGSYYAAGEELRRQVSNLANLPFAFRHIALMPDYHTGYGMPIGGVLAAREMVLPNAVGVDIGCGVAAVRLAGADFSREALKAVLAAVRQAVPVGFARHKRPVCDIAPAADCPVVAREFDNAHQSMGTLGGGNHFIEIQQDEEGCCWIMVHSGSRNLGKQVAEHYNRLAVRLNQRSCMVPPQFQLAALPVDSHEGQAYIREMNYCAAYADANRLSMLNTVLDIVCRQLHCGQGPGDILSSRHNYAVLERHFGKDVWVHRKGAVRAAAAETVIIPGSQGSFSYIGSGLGNPESFLSCSHGAGRRLGRREAVRTLILQDEQDRMKGILHSLRSKSDLEESVGAYKDIEQVMARQADLVRIVHTLRPLAVIKG